MTASGPTPHPPPGAAPQQSPCVVLVDDDAAVRDALASLLASVGLRTEAHAGAEAFLAAMARRDPASLIGCLVLDLRMPGLSGLQLLEQLGARGVDLPVILLTGHGDLAACRRAFRAGAAEFLTKPVDETELLDAVHAAVRRHMALRRRGEVTREAEARLARLTEREREVLAQIAEGLSNKEIARLLGVSPRTVETHRANLFDKLGVDSLAQLVRLYLAALRPEAGEGPWTTAAP